MIDQQRSSARAPRAVYANTRFTSASPLQQRISLLDGAIAAALGTAAALERRELDDAHDHASICRGLLLELAYMIRGPSMPQLASAMNGLTVYLHGLMVQAMTDRSPGPAQSVARLLESERRAWAERLRDARDAIEPCLRADAVA